MIRNAGNLRGFAAGVLMTYTMVTGNVNEARKSIESVQQQVMEAQQAQAQQGQTQQAQVHQEAYEAEAPQGAPEPEAPEIDAEDVAHLYEEREAEEKAEEKIEELTEVAIADAGQAADYGDPPTDVDDALQVARAQVSTTGPRARPAPPSRDSRRLSRGSSPPSRLRTRSRTRPPPTRR